MQDHTKGKKLHATPAIAQYGDDKDKPEWYDAATAVTADSVHTWVKSYADHHGYGWWDPDQYTGASAHPHGYHGFDKNGHG